MSEARWKKGDGGGGAGNAGDAGCKGSEGMQRMQDARDAEIQVRSNPTNQRGATGVKGGYRLKWG
jgi:hypothetical protein